MTTGAIGVTTGATTPASALSNGESAATAAVPDVPNSGGDVASVVGGFAELVTATTVGVVGKTKTGGESANESDREACTATTEETAATLEDGGFIELDGVTTGTTTPGRTVNGFGNPSAVEKSGSAQSKELTREG